MGLRRKSLLSNGSVETEQGSSCSQKSSPSNTNREDNVSSDPGQTSPLQNCYSSLKEPFYRALSIGVTASEEFSTKTTDQRVEAAKEQLGQLECEVISSLFPLAGSPQSYETIATRLGMTVGEVKDIADNALRGLRGSRGQRNRTSSVLN